MIILLSALAYLAAGFVGAAPVPLTHPTGPAEPSYVAHSGRRGTIDILLSSIITLTLCVYTSIHLNITPPRKFFGIRSVWIYKFYWVLIAMFAPEFVLYAAYLQWRNAWELRKLLKELGGKERQTMVQEIGSWFASRIAKTLRRTEATSWIVNTLQKAPTTSPGTPEQPETSRSESKKPELVQQESVGSNLEQSGSEQRGPVVLDPDQPRQGSKQPDSKRSVSSHDSTTPSNHNSPDVQLDDTAERQQSGLLESVPLDSEHPRPKRPTIQPQGWTQPDATHRNLTRPDSTLPDVTQSDSIQPASTQTDPTSPHTPQSSSPTSSDSTMPSNPNSPDVQPGKTWCDISMVSAFYIVMGGFAYNTSDISDDYPYVALTPEGFMEFAKAELITPDILNDKDIADRSKADSLGKLLVCVQALWMVVNCIARKASGRPTTLIELNVIVHVVVAVVVYGLWWYKPLAVANPTLLPQPLGGAEILEILVTLRNGRLRWSEEYNNIFPAYPADANHKNFNIDTKPYTLNPSLFEVRCSPDPKTNWARHVAKLKITTPGLILLPGQLLLLKKVGRTYRTRGRAVHISGKALHLWALVSLYSEREEYDQFTAAAKMNRVFQVTNSTTYDPPNYSVQGSVYTGGIHTAGFDFDLLENAPLMFMTGLLSCLYAGSHASAWPSHFPSYIERWIWRGACIGIAAGVPFVCAIWYLMGLVCDKLDDMEIHSNRWKKTVTKYLQHWVPVIFSFFFGLTVIVYICSRLFIPLEAFISIRSLPVGAFETVEWAEYWPHV